MANTPYLAGSGSAASGGSTLLTVTLSTSVADADNIYVGVIISSAGVTITVTDTQDNTYTEVLTDTANATSQLRVFSCEGANALVAGTDTVKVTYSTNASVQGAIVMGDNNTSTADKLVITHGTSTAPSVASGTLTQAEEHGIAFIADANAGGNPTWGAPFSSHVVANITGGATTKLSAAWTTVTATSSVTASGTIVSAAWAAAIIMTEVEPVAPTLIMAGGVQGEAYSQTLEAQGGNTPYTWTISSGSLPTGLTLASGVISGTPTVNGTFTFTTRATDANGVTGDLVQTITILPNVVSGAPALTLPNNLLTSADSLGSGSPTWAADVNAGTPAVTTQIALVGSSSLRWASSNDGLTQIATGFYNVTPSQNYVASGFLLPAMGHDVLIGISWYTSGSTFIRTDYGNLQSPTTQTWQPLTFRGLAPSNAAKCKVVFQLTDSNKGEVTHITLVDLRPAEVQVLIDWINPAFASGSPAGNGFMDVSPFLRLDAGINMNRGRNDAMSDVNAGSASFTLQNDTGVFSRDKNTALVAVMGGAVTVQRRYQIACADENGAWNVRADGPLTDFAYTMDNTGNTNQLQVTGGDVMSFMSRQHALDCWTLEQVRADQPLYLWVMDDSGAAGGSAIITESSGNNGPTLRAWNSDNTKTATINFQDGSGGVETLANAVKPQQDDGGGFWSPGSNAPNSRVRGLVSGAVGPFSTPQPGINLVPKLTAQSSFNLYVGNIGYQLNGTLPVLNAATSDYSFECWFTMDPGILANIATKFGPYVVLSFGNSTDNTNIVAGIFPTGTAPHNFKVNAYAQPPAFLGRNFTGGGVPATTATIGGTITADAVALPHHLVITITGTTMEAFLDSISLGTATLPAVPKFDTICVGGAFGNMGCHWGNVSLASIYGKVLDATTIETHTMMGQYGMWEQASDDCIAAIAGFADIPPYWNNLVGAHAGLSLMEYQDINGSNALSAMQNFEQAEGGLLFVDASGALNFHARDERMGRTTPDLLLPPDTYDSSMGLGVTDQFLNNEASFSTQVDSTGASYINKASQDNYGVYAKSSSGSPTSLPLITWSRAYGQLGLSSFYYFADPNLSDRAAWEANSNAEPWLTPGQLTIDLLTLDKAHRGIGISNIYALDIDSLIAPTGTLPTAFPDASFSTDWFIESVTEFISDKSHTIAFNLSPAETQRAWKPGNATYGVLGTTTRLGISAADDGPEQADGKDVSHDAGRPFWPPAFTTRESLNSRPVFADGTTGGWTGFQGSIAIDDGTLYSGGPQKYSVVMTSTVGQAGSAEETGDQFALVPGDIISVGAWVYLPGPATTATIGVDWLNSGHSFLSTGLVSLSGLPLNTWTYISAPNLTAPASTAWAYVRVGTNTTSGIIVATDIRAVRGMLAPADMNDPDQDGFGFVGANDMRGITDNLQLMTQPPMLVVGNVGQNQSFPSGSNSTPQAFWDTVYVDTEGGMGLMPGWPNWYVVTVPGWYDIDASFTWATSASAGGTAEAAWLCVAQAGAQGLAAGGTVTPVLNGVYVCPIGEQQRVSAVGTNISCNASTRMYLGIGDMVTVCADQNTGTSRSSGTGFGGSRFSLLYRGLGQSDDRAQLNSTITGGSVSSKPNTVIFTKVYKNQHTYSYWGKQRTNNPKKRRNTDGTCYQSTWNGSGWENGSQVAQIDWPSTTIKSDLTVAGTVKILSVTLAGNCQNAANIQLGWSTQTPGADSFDGSNVTNRNKYSTHTSVGNFTLTLPSTFASHFQDTNPISFYLIGNGTTIDTDYYGYWKGGPNNWTLTIQYSVTN